MTRRKRSYHHGDLREALIAAGTGILKRHGIGALTLRACARAADVSHAAPKHHFPALADLLAEIAARGFETFVAALDAAGQDAETPRLRLTAMCRAYISFARDNPAIYALMFRQDSAGLRSHHLGDAAIAAWRQLEAAVAEVLGTARESDAKIKAAFVWSSVHGAATLLIDRRLPPEINQESLIETAATAISAALDD